jgi:LysR family transcriptional regulator (chromosome initiation inhibitor)
VANLSLDYSALAALTAVVRCGSFEKAAVAIAITSSAVSQRVKGLEERVGATLVMRTSPCRATIIGSRLIAHFERVRLLEDDVFGALPNRDLNTDAPPPTIRIAVNGDSLSTWFPGAIARFIRRSDCLLDLTLLDEEHTADLLRAGDVCAAVTSDSTPVQGCKIKRLGQLRYVAVAATSFHMRHFASGFSKEALSRAPMLSVSREDRLQARFLATFLGEVPNPPTHWVPSTQGFVDLLRSGLGWGMVPQSLAEQHIGSNELCEIDPGNRLDVELFWQYPRLFEPVLKELSHAVLATARTHLVD